MLRSLRLEFFDMIKRKYRFKIAGKVETCVSKFELLGLT